MAYNVPYRVKAPTTTTPKPNNLAIALTPEVATGIANFTSLSQFLGPGINASWGSASYNANDPDGFTNANGNSWSLVAYSYVDVPGGVGRYRNDAGTQIDLGTDPNDGQPFSISYSFSGSSNAVGYQIDILLNGGYFNSVDVGTATGGTINVNSTFGGQFAAWGSYGYQYQPPPPFTPSDPFGMIVPVQQNGSGSFFADGKSYAYEWRAYAVATDGRKYVSSGTLGSGTFSDDNSFQNFYWSLSGWDAVSKDGFFLRRSINGGPWEYTDIGNVNVYDDTGFGNDPGVEARWDVQNPSPIPRSYEIYAERNFSGTPYYSSTASSDSATDTNPPEGYVFVITGTSASGLAKIIGSADGTLTNGANVSGSSFTFIDHPSAWGAGSDVSLKHVGFTRSEFSGPSPGQISLRAFAQVLSPITYYSANFDQATATLPNDGNYYTIGVSFTKGAGSANTRILRSQGGGAFNAGVLVGGTGFTYYRTGVSSTNPGWFDGTTTTPNSIPGSAFSAETTATSTASQPCVIARASVPGGAPRFAVWSNSSVEIAALGYDPAAGRAYMGSASFDTDLKYGSQAMARMGNFGGGAAFVTNPAGATAVAFRAYGNNGLHVEALNDTLKLMPAGSGGLMSFWGASPVARPNFNSVSNFTVGSGSPMLATSSTTGDIGGTSYTFGSIVRALKSVGLITP